MNKKIYVLTISLLLSALTSCNNISNSSEHSSIESSSSTENISSSESSIDESKSSTTSEISSTSSSLEIIIPEDENTEEFKITTSVEDGFTIENNIYTIVKSGKYSLTGRLSGQLFVNIPADDTGKLTLTFDGITIINDNNSPIFVESCDKVQINLTENTNNYLYDTRESQQEESEDSTVGNAALYAKCDLKIKGTGYLYVEGRFNNGIQSKDDLSISESSIYVKSHNNAIKGNDDLTIESGNIVAISTGGDALKTDNSKISSKGNQKGNITISGGKLDLYACKETIDAAYDVIINGNPEISCYTDSFSDYSEEISSVSNSKFYLRMSSSYYSTNYRYSLYLYNDDIDNGTWVNLSYDTFMQSGGRPGSSSGYYYYKGEMPSGYQNIKVYKFSSSQNQNSLINYESSSDGGTINTSKDMITITSSGNYINISSWGTYSTQSGPGGNPWGPGGGMNQGNPKAQDYSTKGIKADNKVLIEGGVIKIESTDDGIHANNDNTLENGESPLGDVEITGGDISIKTLDDGIHADNTFTISGGNVVISDSYEGIEGHYIYLKGGNTKVYAKDDGINGSGINAQMYVTGGYHDVTVPTGDTDTIDVNGSLTMTGGTIFAKNGNQGSSRVAGTFDCDGTISITGGTVMALGMIEGTIAKNSISSTSKTLVAGNYVMKDNENNVLFAFETTQSYTAYIFFSSEAISGVNYTLYKDNVSLGINYQIN